MASRTVRHRFLQATGLTQTHILQIQRAANGRRRSCGKVFRSSTRLELAISTSRT